jgi:hypothetical protein
MLVYFHYLDKNPGWVTDYGDYAEFPEDYYTCGSPVNRPCRVWRLSWRVVVTFFHFYYRLDASVMVYYS